MYAIDRNKYVWKNGLNRGHARQNIHQKILWPMLPDKLKYDDNDNDRLQGAKKNNKT